MGGSTPHGQHNKAHKTGKHQAKGQRHKQREAKGAPPLRNAHALSPASLTRCHCVTPPLLPAAVPGTGGRATGAASRAVGRRQARLQAAKQQRATKRAEVVQNKRNSSIAPKVRVFVWVTRACVGPLVGWKASSTRVAHCALPRGDTRVSGGSVASTGGCSAHAQFEAALRPHISGQARSKLFQCNSSCLLGGRWMGSWWSFHLVASAK
jgi:hypothetical protein